jgi:hypothetical protein
MEDYGAIDHSISVRNKRSGHADQLKERVKKNEI